MTEPPIPPSEMFSPEDYIQAMLNKTQNNRELAVTLFVKLFKQLPEQINDIKLAFQKQDFHQAKSISHDLHGSVGFCGFTAMQSEAKQLEKMFIENKFTSIDEQILCLTTHINQFKAFERQIIDSFG